MTDLFAQIQTAANSGAFGLNGYALPTAEQCRAGNYRKGRVKLYGFDIAIETPQGQRRMGKSDGKPWSVTCMAHYGDISGTRGADGDPVDCYVGPSPESNRVFVVNQNGKGGAFDEHKVMLAFADEDAARSAYMGSYERGWTGLGSMVSATVSQFSWWLKYGDTTKPFTSNALPYDGDDDMTEIKWDSEAMPANSDLATVIYGLRLDDRDGLLLDAVQMSDIMEDAESFEVLDALVVENAKLQIKMAQLERIMGAAGESVKPVAMQLSEPFKQKGTTNITALFELSDGQTVAIFFHNPDSTPNKLLPQDELVSWKWLLNKKDVTILVAPEKGRDLNPREVARRVMKLAERNSAKFQKANGARAERLAAIEQAKEGVSAKESTLASLDAEVAKLTVKAEARRANQAPQPGAASLHDVARGMIPAEFETREDAEGFTAIAADGYGIRLRLTAGDRMLGAYILKPGVNAQESLGAGTLANGIESAVRVSVDTALMFINKWRAESAIDWTKAEELDTSEAIRALGVARINDVGSENVYVEKYGKPFYFKPGNTDAYAIGEHDFSEDKTFAHDDPAPAATSIKLDAKPVADMVVKAIPFGKLYSMSDYKRQIAKISSGLVSMGLKQYQANNIIDRAKTLTATDSRGGPMMFMAASKILAALREAGMLNDAAAVADVPAPQTVESIAAQYAAELSETEKSDLLTGFMPERVTAAADAAGVSPKAVLSAMQQIVEAEQEAGAGASEDDLEQAKYTPFDRSKVKMPTAVQLLLNTKGFPIIIDYDGKDGWSNGHLLALSKPKLVTDAIAKYHVDEQNLRKLGQDAVARVIPKDATVRLEPIADFAGEEPWSSSTVSDLQRKAKKKYKAVVLANQPAGVAVQVDANYFGYFDKTYKKPDYFVGRDGQGAVVVKKAGEIVGVMMPMKAAGNVLMRAAKAAGTDGTIAEVAPGWETNGEEGTLRRDTLTKDELGKVYVLTVGGQYGSGYWEIKADDKFIRSSPSSDNQSSFAALRAKGQTAFYEYLASEHKRVTAVPADANIGRKWMDGQGNEIEVESLKDGKYYTLMNGKVGGAPIYPAETLESYIALDERQYQDKLARDKLNAEQEAADEDAKARRADTDGFAEQFQQVQADRIRTLLARDYSTRKGVMSMRDFIRALVAEGRVITDWHGERVLMDVKEQQFIGEKDITKTGLDYAAYLIARKSSDEGAAMSRADWEDAMHGEIADQADIGRSDAQGVAEAQADLVDAQYASGATPAQAAEAVLAASAVPGGDDQADAARELLQSVIDGSADMNAALADRLQAVHEQYESNAEIMDLFEKAANAFSDAMIAKAKAALAA